MKASAPRAPRSQPHAPRTPGRKSRPGVRGLLGTRGSVEREGKAAFAVADADAVSENANAGSMVTNREVEQAFDVEVNGFGGA